MQLRCPHCRNTTERVDDLEEIFCSACGSSFRVDEDHTPASVSQAVSVGRFRLLERVGRGAFGVVWKAEDTVLHRFVAVKILHAGRLASDRETERFLREGRSAAQLRHAGIVPVLEVGQHDGLAYLVTEFVEGVTLADILTTRQLSFREAAELVAQVAESLDYAHTMGVVHRDIKPSNIMLDRAACSANNASQSDCRHPQSDPPGERSRAPAWTSAAVTALPGKPKLMDFGLARRDEGETTMTLDGQVLGTPAYMSPEQAAGLGHIVDARSDVYGMGVVLYELLVGELPFRGNSRMLIDQVLREEPRAPRRLNDKIPRDLETITLKAMAKDWSRRYTTAGAMADDLRRWLNGELIRARPASTVERAWNWARRRPAVAALIATSVIAVLAVGGVLTGLTYNARLQAALGETDAARNKAELAKLAETEALRQEAEQRKIAQDALAQVRRSHYFNRIGLAGAEWNAANVHRVEELLRDCPPEHRHWEWYYLNHLCHTDRLTFKGHQGPVFKAIFSPNGEWVATASQDGTVRMWNAKTAQPVREFHGHSDEVEDIAFSLDGSRIASVSLDQTARIWDAMAGQQLTEFDLHTGPLRSVAFSPKGNRVATGGEDKKVKLWDATTGTELLSLDFHDDIVWSVAFSPDGAHLASADANGHLKICDAETGKETVRLAGHSRGVRAVAFNRDATRIASACIDHHVKLWDTATGAETLEIVGHTAEVTSVAFSADGEKLASSCMDQTMCIWDAKSGDQLRTLKGHGGPIRSIAFSPDSLRLLSASEDHTAKIWNTDQGQDAISLPGYSSGVLRVVFSQDGKRLATAGYGPLKIWDAESLQALPAIPRGHAGPIWSLAFSPDGQWLATAGNDKTVRVRDIRTGAAVFQGSAYGSQACVAISPDGTRLAASGTDNTVLVWELPSGREALRLEGHRGDVQSVAFSPNGKWLVSGGKDSDLRIWDAATGRLMQVLAGPNKQTLGVAFSPDSRLVASADPDRMVRLWDVQSGKETISLHGHARYVHTVAFSPDGKRLASGSSDTTIKIWDVATGQEILTLRGHTNVVRCVVFSPDGKRLASASSDQTVKIWDSSRGYELTP